MFFNIVLLKRDKGLISQLCIDLTSTVLTKKSEYEPHIQKGNTKSKTQVSSYFSHQMKICEGLHLDAGLDDPVQVQPHFSLCFHFALVVELDLHLCTWSLASIVRYVAALYIETICFLTYIRVSYCGVIYVGPLIKLHTSSIV